jgi:hypothetical protein
MQNYNSISELDREGLLELLTIFAKNWLAHDGCWFQSIEEKLGIDSAIDLEGEAWRKFTVIEAKRIIEFLQLPVNSGLEGLARALGFRLYSTINKDKIELVNQNKLIYYVESCRVQEARKRKGLLNFPCKSVGIVEYSYFAMTIDSRIKTNVFSCPPDITDKDNYCIWEFTIEE